MINIGFSIGIGGQSISSAPSFNFNTANSFVWNSDTEYYTPETGVWESTNGLANLILHGNANTLQTDAYATRFINMSTLGACYYTDNRRLYIPDGSPLFDSVFLQSESDDGFYFYAVACQWYRGLNSVGICPYFVNVDYDANLFYARLTGYGPATVEEYPYASRFALSRQFAHNGANQDYDPTKTIQWNNGTTAGAQPVPMVIGFKVSASNGCSSWLNGLVAAHLVETVRTTSSNRHFMHYFDEYLRYGVREFGIRKISDGGTNAQFHAFLESKAEFYNIATA
jgi:hypothetical protein